MSLCIVTINSSENFLLPKLRALQLVDLISESHRLQRGYGKKHEVQGAPFVQLETVTQEELIYTEETTQEGATP